MRLADEIDRDATIARLAERGVATKAYLPCIHLFPHLRELGYREGQFPVAEAASARSLALPFFPAMTESQVARVCEALAESLALMSRFRKDPDPRFWRINRSLEFDWQLAPYDIDQSQAHARALRRIGVLDEAELEQIDAGLEQVGERIGEHGFEFDDADEDIHMAIERLLGEEIGPLAGKLHTGRSRNDQVATDVAMVVQAHSLQAIELAGAAMERLLELAERHRDWPMPGYTHLQRAQPVYLGHHLLAYFWMLARDVLRFQFALDSASVMPLGSGALAGVNWEIDRGAVADDLGFEHVTHNSIDGASNRDFVLDYLSAASTCAMHLSRLGSEIVIWSSTRVRLLRARRVLLLGLVDHAAEGQPRLGRAAAGQEPPGRRRLPRPAGHDARAAADLRQGHAGGQGAALRRDRHGRVLPRRRPRECSPGSTSTASASRRPPATRCWRPPRSPTCWFARACPSARRTGSSAAWSAMRSSSGKSLSELTPEELRERSEHLDDSFYEVLQRESWLESKRIEGGTGSAALAEQIALAHETLAAVKARVLEERE